MAGFFARYDKLGMALKWGAIWGAVEGYWLLAPDILRSHALYPASAFDWLLVLLFLFSVFTMIGVVCSLVAGLPVFISAAIVKRNSLECDRPCGAVIGVLLPVMYLVLAYALVMSANLGSVPPLTQLVGGRDIRALLSIAVLIPALFILTRRWRFGSRGLCAFLALIAVLGVVLLPYRLRDLRPSGPETALMSSAGPTPIKSNPVLFIGIDGAGWQSIRPLVDSGRLPLFKSLIDKGRYGTVEALWAPYLSGPAWSAMLTGFSRQETGIYEDLMVSGKLLGTPFQLPLMPQLKIIPILLLEYPLIGLEILEIHPPTRSMLNRAPVWELLAEALRTIQIAVVRFWFTYPAERDIGPILVTDWVGKDAWASLPVNNGKVPGMVSPRSLAPDMLNLFGGVAAPELSDFVDVDNYAQPPDSVHDPLEMLQDALRIDSQTLAASRSILEKNPNLDCLMVYLGGFDVVSHALWQYRFPETYPGNAPAAGDVERLGPIVDRYLEFLDRELSRLVAGFKQRPNVVIVSDHGHEANRYSWVWRSQHSRQGIFIASGPNVPPEKKEETVSYYDIVPTLLHLFGIEQPREFRGRSVLKGDTPLQSRPGVQ